MITLRRLFAFSSVKPYDAAKDYYKILNVSQSAGADEIKKSYRNLAKKYHPDSNKGKEEQFKAINEAYQVLSDLQVKKEYDNIRFSSRQSESQSSKSDYQRTQSSSQRTGFSQQQSNYRGYTEEQGWQNKSYREQILHDLHQAHRRFTQESPRRATFHRSELSEEMKRKMAEQLRQQQQHIRKITRQEAERRERQYREYQDQTYQDVGQKAKEKLKEMAAGVSQTAQGFVKVGSFVKQLWDLFKKK